MESASPQGRNLYALLCLTLLTTSSVYSTQSDCIKGDCAYGHGVFLLRNGDIYEGEFIDGMRDGTGTYAWANGNKFDGVWKEGRRTNGPGTFTWISGSSYVGNFVDGERNGQGIFTWANGNSFEGVWNAGKRMNGPGTYTWANGDKYVGLFVDSKRSGQGTYDFTNGDFYKGEFKYGTRDGVGAFTWSNGDKYVGDFARDHRHGLGTIAWVDGNRYVGDFRADQRTGHGEFTWANGDIYVGAFLEGRLEGEGILYDETGYILQQGIWSAGELAQSTYRVSWDEIEANLLSIHLKSWNQIVGITIVFVSAVAILILFVRLCIAIFPSDRSKGWITEPSVIAVIGLEVALSLLTAVVVVAILLSVVTDRPVTAFIPMFLVVLAGFDL